MQTLENRAKIIGKHFLILGALTILSFFVIHFGTERSSFAQYTTPVNISSTVPTDVQGGLDATTEQLATFAWEEFIALNWPAMPRSGGAVPGKTAFIRGQADTSVDLGATGADGLVVWETFKHKAETYPGKITTVQTASSYTPPSDPMNPEKDQLPPFDSALGYGYGKEGSKFPLPPSAGTGNPNFALFNNLDEASQIGLDYLYFTPIGTVLVFEAKLNQVIYDYVRENGLQDGNIRSAAAARTAAHLTGTAAPVHTPMTPTKPKYIELPNGSIEIKASWRFYDEELDKDQLDRYHHRTGIYYNNNEYYNARFLLVGLHIIQKTPHVQTFTFATFEHVDNEKHGFQLMNTGPPPNPQGLYTAIRQHELPSTLVQFNSEIQQQLKQMFGTSVVWANYQLIGVQAKPSNIPPTPPPTPPDTEGNPKGPAFQEYFLANFATETNSSLQYFTGTQSVEGLPTPGVTNVYQPNGHGGFNTYSAGGCLGCHGVAQVAGFDFSFLLDKAPFTTVEGIEEAVKVYPKTPNPMPQNASGISGINPVTPQPLP